MMLVSTSTLAKYKIRDFIVREQEYKQEKTDAENFKKNHQHCTITVWGDYSIW